MNAHHPTMSANSSRPGQPLWHNAEVAPTASRGPGRPPAAKAAETRQRIVRAAREVFSELGYDAATFQQIAARADLTRPAINHYFSSKPVLYREVIKQTNATVVTPTIEKASAENTIMGQLSAFIRIATQVDAEDRSAAAFLVTSILESQRHPELVNTDQDPLQHSRNFVTYAINGAIARGELTTDTDVPSIVELLVAVMWGVGFYAGFVGSHAQLETISGHLEKLFSGRLWDLSE
jgi:AcrR family transcriptional regulator